MVKRVPPGWLPKAPAPDDPGYPFWKYADNMPVSRRAIWLEPQLAAEPTLAAWVDALEAADKRNDKKSLADLLKSNHLLGDHARYYIADWIELQGANGAPRTPAYDRTATEAALAVAIALVKEQVEDGVSVANALADVSKSGGIPPDTLEGAYLGTRGSTRAMAKRR